MLMILQSFKLKNINRKTEKHLQKDDRNTIVNNQNIKSVLIFVDADFTDVELSALAGILSVEVEDIQKITFYSGKMDEVEDNAINPKDFGLFGNFKKDLNQLNSDKDIDLIINYTQDNIYVNNVIAQLRSSFSVGVKNENGKIFDLIIDVDKNELKLFNEELGKYLKILKKI